MADSEKLGETYQRPSALSELFSSPRKPEVARPEVDSPDVSSDLANLVSYGEVSGSGWHPVQLKRSESEQDWFDLFQQDLRSRLEVVPAVLYPPKDSFSRPDLLFTDDKDMPSISQQRLPHALSSAISDDIIDAISRTYEAEDWAATRDFLSAHPDIISLLSEARPYLSQIFGDDVPVRLNLASEHDGEEGCSLFADIYVSDDPAVAFEKLNRYDDDWWLDASSRSKGYLHFSVEFV